MKITLTSICPFCGCLTDIEVEVEQYESWAFGGALIQDALPTLSATERETLISGICPECQDTIFNDEDEDY